MRLDASDFNQPCKLLLLTGLHGAHWFTTPFPTPLACLPTLPFNCASHPLQAACMQSSHISPAITAPIKSLNGPSGQLAKLTFWDSPTSARHAEVCGRRRSRCASSPVGGRDNYLQLLDPGFDDEGAACKADGKEALEQEQEQEQEQETRGAMLPFVHKGFAAARGIALDNLPLTMVSSKRLSTDAMVEVRGGLSIPQSGAMAFCLSHACLLPQPCRLTRPRLADLARTATRSLPIRWCSARSGVTPPASTIPAPSLTASRCRTWCWIRSSAQAATAPCTRVGDGHMCCLKGRHWNVRSCCS